MPLAWFVSQTRLGRKLASPFLRWHFNDIAKNLSKYGLRLEDTMHLSQMKEGEQALALLPKHLQEARSRRLIRASDLSLKHLHLPKDQQNLQQPWRSDLVPIVEHLKERNLERNIYK